jgi:PAS domain S-box-containing protein
MEKLSETVVDEHGRILIWPKDAQRLFKIPEDEAVGHHINMVVPEDKRPEIKQVIQRIRKTKRTVTFATERITRDNQRIPVRLTLKPILDKEGELIGMRSRCSR